MQSQFSMPVSGISKRSDFTTIALSVSGAKQQKMPGEKSLKEKAEQRMEKAKLMEIDRYLKQIKASDDPTYSENAIAMSSENLEDGKKLISENTLLKLIDECKDEEARLSVMDNNMNETKSQISRQHEMT